MIIRFFEILRSKPEKARKKYAISISAVITLLIFASWIAAKSVPQAFDYIKADDAVTPFASFSADFASVGASLKGLFDKLGTREYVAPAASVEEPKVVNPDGGLLDSMLE